MKLVVHRSGVAAFVLGTILLCQSGPTRFARAQSMPISKPTGLLYDDIYLRHLSGNTGHPERPERLIFIRNALKRRASRRPFTQSIRAVSLTKNWSSYTSPLTLRWSVRNCRKWRAYVN